jgi:hypothetical protein
MNFYAAQQFRGVQDGSALYRIKVTSDKGAETKWLNATPAEVKAIAALLAGREDEDS